MKAVRTIYIPIEKEVEVKYYVRINPIFDPHFYEPPYYVTDEENNIKYFDTPEEAEKIKENFEKGWCEAEIFEKIFDE